LTCDESNEQVVFFIYLLLCWAVLNLQRVFLEGKNSASTIIGKYGNFFGQTGETKLLRQKTVVLESDSESGCGLIEDVTEVYTWRVEGDCIDSEHAKKRELNWQHLVCTGDFDWDAHGEFFIVVVGWLFVLLYQEATARL
jgi:hypothetical protein